MYLDTVVLSGIIILVLTCIFMVLIGFFAWRHILADMAATAQAQTITRSES